MGHKKLREEGDQDNHGILAKQGDGARFSITHSIKCVGDASDFTYWNES